MFRMVSISLCIFEIHTKAMGNLVPDDYQWNYQYQHNFFFLLSHFPYLINTIAHFVACCTWLCSHILKLCYPSKGSEQMLSDYLLDSATGVEVSPSIFQPCHMETLNLYQPDIQHSSTSYVKKSYKINYIL